jgi:SSS family solute:Na+ symporter
MILVAQIIASNKFLLSLGLDNTPLFIAFWAIVIIYTTQGGLKAVISTDMVQAAFFSIVFLLSFGLVLYTEPSIGTMQMPNLGNFTDVSSKLTGWLVMPLLFMIIEQDMVVRCFAGASPRVVSLASLTAGLCTMIICVIPVFLGTLASSTDVYVPEGGSVLMAAIVSMTNPLVTALVGCAVLAAIISTATSLINAISSNISSDFEITFSNPMRAIKSITCGISIGAIFFAFYFDNIVDLLIQSYELSVSCLFIPLLIALYKKRGNFLSATLSIAFGAAGFILFRLFPVELPREIASILLSLAGFLIGEALSLYKIKSTCNNN